MIGLYASNGRMGKTLSDVLQKTPYIVFDRKDLKNFCINSDVIIDFSTPLATYDLCSYMTHNNLRCPIVIGTTGLNQDEMDCIIHYSQKAPVFYAQNFSFGVHVQKKISEIAAKMLDFDIEIVEAHHALKKDAPSGTALYLGKSIARARRLNFDDVVAINRSGLRQKNEIGFASTRGGGVVGDHTVHFYGEHEHLCITHNGYSRKIYAIGAIKISNWLINKTSGFYGMDDYFLDLGIFKNVDSSDDKN